jgi:hypothetical protein
MLKKARTQVSLRMTDNSDVVEVMQGSSHETKEEWGTLLQMSVLQVSNDSVQFSWLLAGHRRGGNKSLTRVTTRKALKTQM